MNITLKKLNKFLADAGISNPTLLAKLDKKKKKYATALQAYLKEDWNYYECRNN